MNKILVVFFLLCSNVLFGQQIIKNLQWLDGDQETTELTLGYDLTLYAETIHIADNEMVKITIWEKGDVTDYLVGEYHSKVMDNKISFYWTLIREKEEKQHPLHEVGYIVQYYFNVQYNKIMSDRSKLLDVLSWIRTRFTHPDKSPIAHRKCVILYPDNTEVEVWTDADGWLRIENIRLRGKKLYYFTEEERPQILEPEDIERFKEHLTGFYRFFREDIYQTNGAYFDLFIDTLFRSRNIYVEKKYVNVAKKQINNLINYDVPESINNKYYSIGLFNNGHKKITAIIFGTKYIYEQESIKILKSVLEREFYEVEGDLDELHELGPEEIEERIEEAEIYLNVHKDVLDERDLNIIRNDMDFVWEFIDIIHSLIGG